MCSQIIFQMLFYLFYEYYYLKINIVKQHNTDMKYLWIAVIVIVLIMYVQTGKPRKNDYNRDRQNKGFDNKRWSREDREVYKNKDKYREKYNRQYKKEQYNRERYHYEKKEAWKKQKGENKKKTENKEEEIATSYQCNAKPVYDSNILVLVWPIQYCEETGECNNQWQSVWDAQTPILKGFWPAGSDQYFYNCFGFDGDHNCRKNAFEPNFNFEKFLANDTDLVKKIDNFWSPFHFGDDAVFYKQEWVKHGMCYLMNMIQDNPKAYEADPSAFNKTILTEYFKNGIEKTQKLDIILSPEEQYLSKEQFAKVIGFEGKQDHFNLVCGKDDEVDEIHICFNRTRIPGKETTIPCPPYDSCQKYQKFKFR